MYDKLTLFILCLGVNMFEQVIGILFPVFMIVLVGFSIGRWLKPDFRPINRINMDTLTPALVFSSLVAMPLSVDQVPLLSAGLIALLLPGLLMWPICRLFQLNFKAWAPLHMFRNSGNLAIPLFTYTFGDTALAPAVLLFVISACTQISVGISLLSDRSPFKQMVRMPIFIAAIAALTINFSGIALWKPLFDATSLLGQAAVPVMLLSLGSQMCGIRLKGLKIGVVSTLLSLLTGGIAFGVIYMLVPLPTLQPVS